MKIAVQSFQGVAPKIAPRYLPDGAAQVAINVEAFGQSLKPLKGPGVTTPLKTLPAATRSIYKFGQNLPPSNETEYWLSGEDEHDVCRSQISGDGTREWTFWTGGGTPRATYGTLATQVPTRSLRLGLPAPTTALSGFVGEPEYCEVGGVRDGSITTATDCQAAGTCRIGGVVNNIHKTEDACNTAGGEWEAGAWITGAKQSPAVLTLTPDILGQINSQFGLDLSTDNGTHYQNVKPSSAGAPKVYVGSSQLEQMLPEYPLRVSLDNERTWASVALPSTVSQRAEVILYGSEMPMGYYPFIVRVTGGAYARSFTRPFSQDSLSGMATVAGVASEINRWAADLDNFVTAVVRGNNVYVTTRSIGANVELYIEWGSNAFRRGYGASLTQAQDAFIAALPNAKINNLTLATATRTATDQVTVTATRAGADVTLVVRWWDLDGAKLVATGTPGDTAALVTAIKAVGTDSTYSGATAEQVGDDVVVTSLLTGKDAKLRVRWGDGSTQYRSTSGVTSDLGTLETRVYTYTWVLKEADMEWESAPYSAETMPSFDVYPDGRVTLFGFEETAVLTAAGWGPINGTLHYRIYRAVNGVYLYVGELSAIRPPPTTPIQVFSYTDNKDADQLGEELPSTTWTPPPAALLGLVNLPNGMMAGFQGREVLFCEPYRPYAWPDIYSQSVDYPVVGLGRMDTTLAVLTTGTPYFIQGSSPEVLVMVKSDLEQACVAKRSIVSLGGAVFYASPDGLMMLSSSGSDIITKDLMDRDDWQALHPETLHAYGHDNQYIAFHDAVTDEYGNVIYGFVLDLKSKQFVRHSVQAVAGFNDLRGDTLFLVSADGTLVKWGEGAAVKGVWRSKIFSQPQMNGFACAQVEAGPFGARQPYPLTVRVYADRKLFYTYAIPETQYQDPTQVKLLSRRNPFRLPTLNREHCVLAEAVDTTKTTQAACEAAGGVWWEGYYGRDWEIELEVEQEIFNVALAQSMAEIAST